MDNTTPYFMNPFSSQLLQSTLNLSQGIIGGGYPEVQNFPLETTMMQQGNGRQFGIGWNNCPAPQQHLPPMAINNEQQHWPNAPSYCSSNEIISTPPEGEKVKLEVKEVGGQHFQQRQPFSCLTNAQENNNKRGEKRGGEQQQKEFENENERLKYWERRSKNNEAAKQSRAKRREREQQLSQRVSELEKENSRLREELAKERQKNMRNNKI
jgi:hypothetical protein